MICPASGEVPKGSSQGAEWTASVALSHANQRQGAHTSHWSHHIPSSSMSSTIAKNIERQDKGT